MTWEPIELELEKDGYVARVARTLRANATRWRWSVTPVEVVERHPSQPVEHAYARGFTKGRKRAIETAEVAIEALRKAAKG